MSQTLSSILEELGSYSQKIDLAKNIDDQKDAIGKRQSTQEESKEQQIDSFHVNIGQRKRVKPV